MRPQKTTKKKSTLKTTPEHMLVLKKYFLHFLTLQMSTMKFARKNCSREWRKYQKLTWSDFIRLEYKLEQRQYKNDSTEFRCMLILKLPLFSPHHLAERKSAPISKQTFISTPSRRSYITLALETHKRKMGEGSQKNIFAIHKKIQSLDLYSLIYETLLSCGVTLHGGWKAKNDLETGSP